MKRLVEFKELEDQAVLVDPEWVSHVHLNYAGKVTLVLGQAGEVTLNLKGAGGLETVRKRLLGLDEVRPVGFVDGDLSRWEGEGGQ